MPVLRSLGLATNLLTSLDGMDWTKINTLDTIYLNYNQISDLRNANLNQLPLLNELWFNYNKVSDITHINYNDLKDVDYLSIEGNQISDLSAFDASIFNNLLYFNLKFNKISDLKTLDLTKFKTLDNLALDGNQITDISEIDFSKVPTLKRLSMANQKVTLDKAELIPNFSTTINIKGLVGSKVNISNISNSGVYDSTNNVINWNLTDANTKVTYKWNSPITLVPSVITNNFTGEVTIPLALKYQLTFKDWNDNILSQDRLFEGDNITIPADPTREGYIFNGWSSSVDATMPASDVEYIATYSKIGQPPVIDSPEYTEIKQYSTFDLKSGVKAYDYLGNDITNDVIVDKGDFDYNKPGLYSITYTITDDLGNTIVSTRLILVNDGTYVTGNEYIIQATDFSVNINDVNTDFDVLSNSANVQVFDKATGDLVVKDVIITDLGGFTNVEGVYQITFALASEVDTKITIIATVESNTIPVENPTVDNNPVNDTKESSKVKVSVLPTTGSDYLMITVQLIMLSLVIIGNRTLLKNK